MIKKLLQTGFILLVFLLFSVFVIIKYPSTISTIFNKISHYQVRVENIDISRNNQTIIVSSNHIQLTKQTINTDIKDISLIFDFSNNKFPQISSVIERLTLTINNRYQELPTLYSKMDTDMSIDVDIKRLDINYRGLKINSSVKIRKSQQQLVINGTLNRLDIQKNLDYIKLIKNRRLRQYLQVATKAGYIDNAQFVITQEGNKVLSWDINGTLDRGLFKFHPDWQLLETINANFHANNQQLTFDIASAKIDDLNIYGIVTIDLESTPLVTVAVKTMTNTEYAIDFLKNAPLPDALKQSLSLFKVDGKTQTSVDLKIPLNGKKPQIDIKAQLYDNNFSVFGNKILAKEINAKLQYNDKLSILGVANIFGKKQNVNVQFTDFLQFNLYDAHSTTKVLNKNNNWRINIVSDNVSGEINLDLSQVTPTVYLNDFSITTTTTNTVTKTISFTPSDVTDFKLVTNNITINKHLLPNSISSFSHENNILYMRNLQLEEAQIEPENIKLNIFWREGETVVHATLQGNELNDLFTSFKIDEKTSGGKFKFNIKTSCQCNPWELALSKIGGYADISIKEGVLTEQDPSLARVLSLLNINSLAERLSLQLDDVVNQGFSYDTIDSNMVLATGGVVIIKDFVLRSGHSTVKLQGSFNIIDNTYSLKASVKPTIKDSVPLISALTGSGVTGLGIWLADKFIFKDKLIDSIIGNATTFNYKITGSWENPIIKIEY